VGLRGSEDLGGGLKAIVHLQHRFNADSGAVVSPRFWEGKSIVGLAGAFGTLTMGREENPAYTYGQVPADPWGGDTVAGNGNLVNGRIGNTRYSNSVNVHGRVGGLRFGAQVAEGDGLDDRPYSVGLRYGAGDFEIGLGYENPGRKHDDWLSLSGRYSFGAVVVMGLVGSGTNITDHRHEAWLLAATARLGPGEWRASVGQGKNRDTGQATDEQISLGYHHKLSPRTTLYADLTHEGREDLPSQRTRTGWDLGIKHNF
jgi:predicted porin